MITINILINKNLIYSISAVNMTSFLPSHKKHTYQYAKDKYVLHRRDKGAVPLAIKLLKTAQKNGG